MTLAFDQPPLTDSWLSRRDPRAKLAAVAIAVVLIAMLQTLPAATAAFAGAMALALLARLPRRWYFSRLGAVAALLAPFILLLPLLHAGEPVWEWGRLRLSLYGLGVAALLSLKAFAITTLVLVLLATAPLHIQLQAAHALGVPAFLVQLAALSYRHVFLLADEVVRLRIALRVRGWRNRASLHGYRTLGHVTGTLLVRSHERAERVGQAMRCRGFTGRFRGLTSFHFTAADFVLLLSLLGGFATVLLADLLWRAS